MRPADLKPDLIVEGPLFPERVHVITVAPMGTSVKPVGTGLNLGQTYQTILSAQQRERLTAAPATEPFDGDAKRFRLGIGARRLGLAYEYDPYFSLSIARVDPLPHQLEAVYDYFLTVPRVRFVEVKGRAGVGEVALTSNEYHTAQRLKADYWLYVAFNCGGTPDLYRIPNPGRLAWQPITVVEHYAVDARQILGAATGPLEPGISGHGPRG